MELSRRNALVVGLGKSGVAAARLLLAKGARVSITDGKTEAQLAAPLQELRAAGALAQAWLGGLSGEAFAGKDLVVLSPGISPFLAPVREARERGVETIGEVELASRFIEEPLLGITGTNGKSTTTALTGHLLATAGLRVFVGGNLGTALSHRALEGGVRDATVCELSSYQLETIAGLRCAAAAVLNLTADHLERHPTMEAYAAAKARIFENQRPGDAAVINEADERVRRMASPPGTLRRSFDPRLDAGPQQAGLAARRTGPRELLVGGRAFSLTAKTLRGDHNAENALAALLLARHLGVEAEALQRGLDTYPGLPHRLEPVATIAGVEWVNDSKATNVDSVEKALSAFPAGPCNVLLVLGGKGKGLPYTPLRPLFPGRVKGLLTIGQDAPRIAEELGDLAPLTACGDLATAVARAHALARSGDVVLLAPACASFDQFKDFEDRGDTFRRLVGGLR